MIGCMPKSAEAWMKGILLTLMAAAFMACGSSRVKQEPTGIDADLQNSNQAARLAYENGRLRQAIELYQKALERAYIRDDLAAMVDAHYNMAVCFTGLQAYAEALESLGKAKSELNRAGKKVGGDIQLLEATLLYLKGKPDGAWQITEQILSPAKTAAAVDVKRKTHYLRGIISADRNDTDQLRQEMIAIGRPEHTGLRADREELAGRLAMAENDWNEATAAFDKTADLRRENLDYHSMANALAMAGQACKQAGQPLEASKRFLRAGRSALLQGQKQNALKWLRQATAMADQAGDTATAQEAASYLQQLQNQ